MTAEHLSESSAPESNGPEAPAAENGSPAGDPQAAEPRAPGRPRSRFRQLLFYAALLVGLTWLVREIPRELGRWRAAVALNHRLDGEIERAIAEMTRALRWEPDNVSYHIFLAKWRIKQGRYQEALEDCERAASQGMPLDAELVRWTVLLHLQRFEDAIELGKQLEKRNPQPRLQPELLNLLAYARALGNRDLDSALLEINRAIKLDERNAAMLDTRGFVHYRRGELQAAARDMEDAVRMMRDTYTFLKKTRAHRRVFDIRLYDQQLEEARKSLAVLYYHRALVLEAQGYARRAESDRKEVRRLGFDPSPALF